MCSLCFQRVSEFDYHFTALGAALGVAKIIRDLEIAGKP